MTPPPPHRAAWSPGLPTALRAPRELPGLLNSATSGPRGRRLLLSAPLCPANHRSHGLSFSSAGLEQEGLGPAYT